MSNKQHLYTLNIYKEEEVSWQLQNQIHSILNQAFDGISNKFKAKTYGYTRPLERVIGFLDDMMVAHLGLSKDTLIVNNQSIAISCIGLWASIRKGWASKVMQKTLEHLKNQNTILAIGVSNNDIILKKVLPEFRHRLLDIRLQGKNFSSKESDRLILFPILMTEEELNHLIMEINKSHVLFIKGDPF